MDSSVQKANPPTDLNRGGHDMSASSFRFRRRNAKHSRWPRIWHRSARDRSARVRHRHDFLPQNPASSTTSVHLAKTGYLLDGVGEPGPRALYAAWERGDFSAAESTNPTIEFVIVGGPGHKALGGLRSPRGRVEERERRTDVSSRVPPG
jgi:hypothetical protein